MKSVPRKSNPSLKRAAAAPRRTKRKCSWGHKAIKIYLKNFKVPPTPPAPPSISSLPPGYRLPPPARCGSWIEYAVATMDTRRLLEEQLFDHQPHWPSHLISKDMTDAALAEWRELQALRPEPPRIHYKTGAPDPASAEAATRIAPATPRTQTPAQSNPALASASP